MDMIWGQPIAYREEGKALVRHPLVEDDDVYVLFYWEDGSWVAQPYKDAKEEIDRLIRAWAPLPGTCPTCGYWHEDWDKDDSFTATRSGVQPGTPHGPTVYWVEGELACCQCGARFGAGDSSD